MDNIINIKDARSGIDSENLQEILEAGTSADHALQRGQNQYQTPPWLAGGLTKLIIGQSNRGTVVDPQCANGNLLAPFTDCNRFGIDIDNRFKASTDGFVHHRITGNAVRVMKVAEDMKLSHLTFSRIVANPPFGIRWKLGEEGKTIDSTEWTWNFILKHLADNGAGYLITTPKAIENLKIHEHPWVYLYQKMPAGGVWDNCDVELGIVHFAKWTRESPRFDMTWLSVPSEHEMVSKLLPIIPTMPYGYAYSAPEQQWNLMKAIFEEEKGTHPEYNVFLDKEGMLKTYLSTRFKHSLKNDQVSRLFRIHNCHPLTLTTERETRKLLTEVVNGGIYTIQPEALAAISNALQEVASLACPIMEPTDFSCVAWADEDESIMAKVDCDLDNIKLTKGKRYEITTGEYPFQQRYTRKKLYYDDETETTTVEDHDCVRHGKDRYIQFRDDRSTQHQFMDMPDPKKTKWQHKESGLWDLFVRPYVANVAEIHKELYEENQQKMDLAELVAGFNYYPGQRDYYARMGCKNYGLVAAGTGTGKTCGAMTLHYLKGSSRTLIIAPQGTMRSSGEEEDGIDYQASQWVQEIQKFAPTEPVFQLFSKADYDAVLYANGGVLPKGVFITYPAAYFANNAFEALPASWEKILNPEENFCKRAGLPFSDKIQTDFHRGVGTINKGGIRCIVEPSLATVIATFHGEWDMVILDEAHLIANKDSQITQNFIRLQPKYRFALTATPIPNIITNIFPLMGWLCVPGWYKDKVRNAAWPYAISEVGRFNQTFLSTETDLTAQEKARKTGKKGWRGVGHKVSPIISSPARLLKLLQPTMAWISKEACNPHQQPREVIDVRVPFGREQAKLYAYWLNRKNYQAEFKGNALTIAGVQPMRLRGCCAEPASVDYPTPAGTKCNSNFNPKTVTILQLIRDLLVKGEQVVVVSARVGQSSELARRLASAGVTISRIDSTVGPALHTAEANRFKRGDSRVMLMGIKCAQAHSFDRCSNLIVGSLEWSYGSLHQAEGRVWRLTSPKPVKVWVVLHERSFEEIMFDRVAMKQDSATMCLHGKRVPNDFKTMDAAEILAEHVINFNQKGVTLSETECETQWPTLRKQLLLANTNKPAAMITELVA